MLNISLLLKCSLVMLSLACCSNSTQKQVAQYNNFDSLMRVYKLVDILEYDKDFLIDLKYASTDNFVGRNMYRGLKKAYLQNEIGQMLAKAHKIVQAKNPRWRLLILDAARPMSVQQEMHDVVEGTPLHIYVANPQNGGGRHNYGVAVDCTIVELNENGTEYEWLDMGSGYDDFREQSHLDAQEKGLLTKAQADNRNFLTETMKSVGFTMIKTEWWHFQKYTMNELPSLYKRLNF